MRIQHNIAALSAYRNLTNNNSMVSKNLEKLSSGYRINRAGDDAAGLAISEKMRAQITGLETAQKNANDGISLIQTAEGALTEVHSMLNRMVELANQSANGTYMDDDRESLQAEVDALLDEINRISKSTNFNGRTLLNGDMSVKKTDASAAGIETSDLTDVDIVHLADSAVGKDFVKGEYTLDLTNVKVTNKDTSGDAANTASKATVTDITTKTGTFNAGTATTQATIKYDLAGAKIESFKDGTGDAAKVPAGQTVKLSLAGEDFIIDVTSKEDMDAAAIANAIKEKTTGQTYSIGGEDYTVSVNGTEVTFTSVDNNVTTDPSAAAASIAAENGATKMGVQVEMGGITLDSGISLWGGETVDGAKIAEEIAKNNATVTIDNQDFEVTQSNGVLTFKMKNDPTEEFDTDLTATLKVVDAAGTEIAKAGDDLTGKDVFINQAEAIGVTPKTEAVFGSDIAYAQGKFVLNDNDIKNGTALKIGDSEYVFAVGANSKFSGSNVINLKDFKEGDGGIATAAARRLSVAAAGNKQFKVESSNADGTVLLTEKKDGLTEEQHNKFQGADAADRKDLTTDQAKEAWKGFVQLGKATMTEAVAATQTGGLTLQIGDTSDDFNQLTVSVDDMSAKGLNIEDIDIATQDGAAKAVDQIKDAINTVSAQRGALGALQNRLEHTINNLSVTTENITAAESRIRDVDMANEMMAYTKNNILVQASQAMLAQANQIPQGVLQLLQ